MTHDAPFLARARPRPGLSLMLAGLYFATALIAVPGARAQEGARTAVPPAAAGRTTPDANLTRHTLVLAGRTLSFTVRVGFIKLADAQGATQAEVGYTAYELDGTDKATRPLAFALNGGPGSGSAWLQLGALGPWRIAMTPEALAPSATPALIDNDDTWLDFTDLVFLDPPGTGFARVINTGDEARRRYWSVNGDIDALAEAMRRFIALDNRLVSPKFIIGESYSGFRGPRLARALDTREGVGVTGLILLSPVLDFGLWREETFPLGFALRLPTFAAVARAANGPVTRAALGDAETYATTDFVTDVLRGEHDAQALARLSARVAELSGLDPALVARLGGRVGADVFQRERLHAQHRILSSYDATISGSDPTPLASDSQWSDPMTDALNAPVSTAMTELATARFGLKTDTRYELLNTDVNRQWQWGAGGSRSQQSMTDLRRILALDSRLRVMVAHGLYDLVTPYFASKILLDQLPAYDVPDRVTLATYAGGHMFYSLDGSRKAFRDDGRKLIEGK